MTIVGKINALVLIVTGVLGAVVTGITAVREYQGGLHQALERASDLASGLPNLQVEMYFRDMDGLEKSLDRFLETPTVSYVALYDTEGERLLQRGQTGAAMAGSPAFILLRNGLSATEAGTFVSNGQLETGTGGLLDALTR